MLFSLCKKKKFVYFLDDVDFVRTERKYGSADVVVIDDAPEQQFTKVILLSNESLTLQIDLNKIFPFRIH